jgi:hypothetical protein
MWSNLLSSSKNFVATTIATTKAKINDMNTSETCEYNHVYDKDFLIIIDDYEMEYDEENLKKNDIASCELYEETKNDNLIIKKRRLFVNILKAPITIPDQLLQYVGDQKILVDHVLEIDMVKKIAIAKSKI